MKQYRSTTNNFNGTLSVSVPYRFRIILLSFSYHSPITKRERYEIERRRSGEGAEEQG